MDEKERLEREAQAKGGSMPPDLRRNSKSRSEATQIEMMGGFNKKEQKALEQQHALERDQEITQETETF